MRSFKVSEFGRPLACVDAATPEPTGSEVVVRIGSCGVCHSDIHIQEGVFDLGDAGKVDLTRAVAPPRTPGHEIAGTVAALGPDVTGAKVGDKVVVFPWIGCGECSLCQAGEEHICLSPRALGLNRDGGYADHVVVPHERYLVGYEGISEEQACIYACSGLTAFAAIKKALPLQSHHQVLVLGAGGVGLSGIRLLRTIWGIAPIVADIDRGKWAAAEEAGAGSCIDPSVAGAARDLVKTTKGGVEAVLDFVGAGQTLAFGIQAVRKGGRVVLVGMLGGSTPVAPALLAMKEVAIRGSCVGSLAELQELLGIAGKGALPEMPVTKQPLDAANAVLDRLRAGEIVGRAVLKPEMRAA